MTENSLPKIVFNSWHPPHKHIVQNTLIVRLWHSRKLNEGRQENNLLCLEMIFSLLIFFVHSNHAITAVIYCFNYFFLGLWSQCSLKGTGASNHLVYYDYRIDILDKQYEKQTEDLKILNVEKRKLQERMEILAEKYEDSKDRQELIVNRLVLLYVLCTK